MKFGLFSKAFSVWSIEYTASAGFLLFAYFYRIHHRKGRILYQKIKPYDCIVFTNFQPTHKYIYIFSKSQPRV